MILRFTWSHFFMLILKMIYVDTMIENIKEQIMATKAFKEQKIAHIKDYAQKAKVAVVTNYKGLTANKYTVSMFLKFRLVINIR